MKYYILFFLTFIFFIPHLHGQHIQVQNWYDQKKTLLKEDYFVKSSNTAVLDSLYISYYQNGGIKSRGHYTNGKANGIWEYFYENGNPKMKGELRDNISQGYWTYYYENGGINMEGEVIKDLREGQWIFYYESGNIKSEGLYRKNLKNGPWKYYYEDSKNKGTAYFQDDKGNFMEFYPDGTIKSKGEIANGKSNGLWKYYYEDGSIKSEGSEKNGQKEGMWKFYHKNGKVSSEGVFEKGLPEGKWKYFYEDGALSSEGDQKEGKRDGYWKLYYNNGNFKGEGNFVKGEGSYKEYYENGKLKIEGQVKNDKSEGLWKYYYENGKLEGSCFYNQGEGTYTGFYESGTPKMEGKIVDGNKVGVWKLFKENGDLAGLYRTYYENDSPVFREIKDSLNKNNKSGLISKMPPWIRKRKIPRYFVKKVNEYQGFILAFGPLGIAKKSIISSQPSAVPFSVEYYFQERLGYELGYVLIRDPFFKSTHGYDELYKRGNAFYLRQKFYNRDKDNGMFYFGHEIRYTKLDNTVNKNGFLGGTHSKGLTMSQSIVEYSIIFGDRLSKDAKKKGWTVDVFAGLGVGYRFISRNWDPSVENYEKDFLSIKGTGVSIPFRFGVNIGYSLKK
ncbi:toxin-antitoxin system YwqK family antitoxin [Sporocytophaga myxococcoides]|uniref:toxin-antitoxin system YwqK family antitoxin n=1 Tax=Sporocytophaga myxococcoides TaxID=153721 RepID=UPI0004910A77|nr:toxin-antitoxin system YwqK family antitoxin [Sporocytophaga myxococcoides]